MAIFNSYVSLPEGKWSRNHGVHIFLVRLRRKTLESKLVGGLEHVFSIQLGMSSSHLTVIFFRWVGQPPTRLESRFQGKSEKHWVFLMSICRSSQSWGFPILWAQPLEIGRSNPAEIMEKIHSSASSAGVPGLVNIQKANWKMVVEIVDCPMSPWIAWWIFGFSWVNYNELTTSEPWKSYLVREIIPFYGLNSG